MRRWTRLRRGRVSRAPNGYGRSVFINAPFSADRRPIFNAIVFSVQACGFAPRCSLEIDNAGQVRLEKIRDLIRDCHLGIHDISFMELDGDVPRFNMPFELGLFLGAAHFAEGWAKRKACTILDTEQFRYQRALSDIAGQDIRAHGLDPQAALAEVRNWLSHHTRHTAPVPGAATIWTFYQNFTADLPTQAETIGLVAGDLTFKERLYLTSEWLERRAP